MAFLVVLIALQGLIAVVGLLSTIPSAGFARAARSIVEAVAPGPVGGALNTAVDQARDAGEAGRYVAIALGVVGSLVTGTTTMGQLQRTLNRLYGIERDRPTRQKYRLAFGLTVTAGLVIALAFAVVAFGDLIGDSFTDRPVAVLWNVLRVPGALVSLSVAMAVLMRWCPQRRQPAWPWLALGAAVAVVSWVLITLALNAVFGLTSSFGDLYGPLAGVVALLIWAYVSSFGVLYGAAVAAELESFRSQHVSSAPSPVPAAVPG